VSRTPGLDSDTDSALCHRVKEGRVCTSHLCASPGLQRGLGGWHGS
jgi:hypothetical protein